MKPPSQIETVANVALIVVYGAIAVFFLYRYARRRWTTSLTAAFLPSGWIILALRRQGMIPISTLELLSAGAAVLGAIMLTILIRAERVDPGGPRR